MCGIRGVPRFHGYHGLQISTFFLIDCCDSKYKNFKQYLQVCRDLITYVHAPEPHEVQRRTDKTINTQALAFFTNCAQSLTKHFKIKCYIYNFLQNLVLVSEWRANFESDNNYSFLLPSKIEIAIKRKKRGQLTLLLD